MGCYFHHANMPHRETVLTAWHWGTGSPMIVATSALSAGVDYASVRLILHLDAPTALPDYAKKTGRAGRDGAQADCLILQRRRVTCRPECCPHAAWDCNCLQ